MSDIIEAESLERTSLGSGIEEDNHDLPVLVNLTFSLNPRFSKCNIIDLPLDC